MSKKLDIRVSAGAVTLEATEIVEGGPNKNYFNNVFKGNDSTYFDAKPELLAAIEEFWGDVPHLLSEKIKGKTIVAVDPPRDAPDDPKEK